MYIFLTLTGPGCFPGDPGRGHEGLGVDTRRRWRRTTRKVGRRRQKGQRSFGWWGISFQTNNSSEGLLDPSSPGVSLGQGPPPTRTHDSPSPPDPSLPFVYGLLL